MWRFLQKAGWLTGAALLLRLVANVHEPAAWASARPMTEFHHRMWTSDNGIGAVFDIQQASDGYLWLTTSTGVFRFDGVRFQSVEEVTNGAVRNSEIHSAFLSSSGGVWLKTRAAGLVLWKDERLSVFSDRRCTPALQLEGLAEDRDGSLWVQGSVGFFHLRGSVCEPVGAEQGYPGGFPAAILVDSKGTVWVRTVAGALLFLPRGQSKFQLLRYDAGTSSAAFVLAAPTHNSFLHEAPDGSIWLSDDYGLRRVTNTAGEPVFSSPHDKGHKEKIQFGDFTFGADGSLWAVTDKGVWRFEQAERSQMPQETDDSRHESFTAEQGLSSNAAWKVFIDREGSVWIGTNSGLDLLRRTTLTSLALPPTEEHDFGIVAGDGGSVWTGNKSLPLTRVATDGSLKSFPETHGTICLRRDRHGTIWSAGGVPSTLWRGSPTGFAPVHYPEEKVGPVISVAFDRNDVLWITTAIGGAYRFSQGEWSRQNEALGKKPGIIGAMAGDDAGNVWFGFSNYVVRWNGSDYSKFSFPDGTRGVSESTMSVRGDHVWLGGSGGIELFTEGHFYLLNWNNKDLPGRVSGVLETEAGDLWANGSSGITHVSATELARWLRDPTSPISGDHLDARDGLPGFSAERIPEPSIAESSDGRLWFATTRGAAWLDPAKLQENRNHLPPPVMIGSIVSSGKIYVGLKNLALPPHAERLEIDYTALSLAFPERVLFRYMLDGVDKEWQDAGTRRQAFYTSLPPGRYRFRVIACNNDGVWNEDGAFLDFSIAPAYYQTTWFRLLCVAVFLALLWALYQLRLRRLAREFNMRLDERVSERTRIARELHDSLLQGFQGLMFRLQAALHLLPGRPTEAMEALEIALERGDKAIAEGRDTVAELRSPTVGTNDMAQALTALTEELSHQKGNGTGLSVRVLVEGKQRDLDPLLRDEVYRIAREALRNAFVHAHAHKIEAEITYGAAQFLLSVRDDGNGIGPEFLHKGGRAGHWGLPGMRERAKSFGGKLEVWSEGGTGTEVQLVVPASIAYGKSSTRRGLWFLRKQKHRD
jgi:signal transduction histidine kinase/ligand-binding sensor domain-containing protein